MIAAAPTVTVNQYSLPHQTADAPLLLKRAVWLYFLLLIFEGALRKWFLPALATPLLVVRDPIALWILFMAARKGFLPFNIFSFLIVVIGLISFFASIVIGHGNLAVAVYGLRILLLHFPLMIAIGRIFNKEDVIKLGKVVLMMTPLMALLIAVQFYSPQSAWVNKGIGDSTEGAGFSGALEYMRPPATFSFTNGTTLYFSFAAPFVLYFWFQRHNVNKIILLAATAGLLASIPFSISRGLLFSIGISVVFMAIASLYQPRYIGTLMLAGIFALIALAGLSMTPAFQTATDAFSARFEMANKAEGGLEGVLADRYLGGLVRALTYDAYKLPFFGLGIGMGTNVGAMLMSGEAKFLISEGEWGRIIGEMGAMFGLLVILIRLIFTGTLAVASFKKLSVGDVLPWLLLSFALLNIPQGQWAQPTALGFSTLIGGLVLASLRGRS